jgi:CBS domain containing-hemolysin-like protein
VSDQSWIDLALAAIALILMALAATVEAAAAQVGRHRLRQLGEQLGRRRSVQTLLDPRRSLVAGLLLVQAVAVAVAAAVLTRVFDREFGQGALVLAVATVGLVYLVFGQALPRALAAAKPDRAGGVTLAMAAVFGFLAVPMVWLTDAMTAGFARLLGADMNAQPEAEDDLRAAIEAPADGIIEPEEREMIDAVLELEDTPVREIMVPRVDIVAVAADAPAAEVVSTITKAGHSRVPVYRDSIDQVVGILYAKDLLPFVIGNTEQLPLARLVRPAYVVPESKRIDELLAELRLHRVHLAMVVDEYGGTAGLVTIEDIIETIVGDIQDEYDLEPVLLEATGPGRVVVDGSLPLTDLEDALRVDLQDPEDEVATAAGWVHLHLERLPEIGDRFEADGVRAEVLSMEGHRLRQLRVSRLDAIPPVAAPATVEPSLGQTSVDEQSDQDPARRQVAADPARTVELRNHGAAIPSFESNGGVSALDAAPPGAPSAPARLAAPAETEIGIDIEPNGVRRPSR